MDIWNSKEIAKDLMDYIHIIKKYEVSSFFLSVDKLYGLADVMPDNDYYSIESLEVDFVNYKPISKTVPKIAHFTISLVNSLVSNPDIDIQVNDPISEYAFDMIVTGFGASNGDPEYKMAWHLDKDIAEEGDGPKKYSHPLYHFQYGGANIDGLETGALMLMGAPRLPHPPMDIFLSIHFVFNNFFNKEEDDYSCLKNLFADEDYIDILGRAKERMWYPYFKGLTDRSNSHSELNLASLFPLAV
ncbi:MAG: hypothetical protein COA78_36730 [Blastopirellula sp.]|nr:MAG: hypothetical protein COA78_36730 [Blastopirellula sp.]